jgi:hypothetical protein
LSFEFALQSAHLGEKALDLGFDLERNSAQLNVVLVVEFCFVDGLDDRLTIFKASTDLVWQPGGDRSAAGGSGVLRVVYYVLLGHYPVLMSETEGRVDVSQH